MSQDDAKLEEINRRQADDYWVLVRHEICNTYLGLQVVPVPYLVDAEHYDLLNVLLERSESLGSQLLRRKSFFPLGSLKEIMVNINDEKFEVTEQNIQSIPLSRTEFKHEEVVIDEGVLKSIKLVVKDVNKEVSLFLINPGTLKLTYNLPWIYSVRNVYVIYEVFYTTDIQLLVSDSKQTQQFRSKNRIPIGFHCKKFKLSSGGIIGIEVPLKKSLIKENFVNTSSYTYAAVVGKHFTTSAHQLPHRNVQSTSLFRSILPDCCFCRNQNAVPPPETFRSHILPVIKLQIFEDGVWKTVVGSVDIQQLDISESESASDSSLEEFSDPIVSLQAKKTMTILPRYAPPILFSKLARASIILIQTSKEARALREAAMDNRESPVTASPQTSTVTNSTYIQPLSPTSQDSAMDPSAALQSTTESVFSTMSNI